MMRPHAARGAWFAALLALTVIPALGANQEIAACRISGRAAAGGTALPGVSIIVTVADATGNDTTIRCDRLLSLAAAPHAHHDDRDDHEGVQNQ
jgi:hypothetical protein